MLDKLKYIQDTFKDISFDESKINSIYAKKDLNESNFTIKLLSIIGGFFSSFALVIFIAISGIWTSGNLMLFFGLLSILFAVLISIKTTNILLDTFSISTYIIGIMMLVFGMQNLKIPVNNTIYTILIIGIITLLLNPDFVFSFIASLIIQGSILFFIFYNKIEGTLAYYIVINTILLVLLFFKEAYFLQHKKLNKLYYPFKMAIIVAYIFGLSLLTFKNFVLMDWLNWLVLTFGIGILFLITVYKIVKTTSITNKKILIFIYIASFLIAMFSYYTPTIIGGLIPIILGFYQNNKVVFILGVLSFIAFTGMYYYNLNETLLFKSVLLILIGSLFLVSYLIISKNNFIEKI
ncbi:MAG TPA: DUF4401 domain-containing protein [Flavobacteriia bacterium]|nr:DUF4401 domain-containing protein [Flavobacteriia bacterium]